LKKRKKEERRGEERREEGMEPPSSAYEAFNLEADYEGGQWIGGEFFFEAERKKRKFTKEDHIYGIFNDDGDGDGGEQGRSRSFKVPATRCPTNLLPLTHSLSPPIPFA